MELEDQREFKLRLKRKREWGQGWGLKKETGQLVSNLPGEREHSPGRKQREAGALACWR